MDTSKFTPEAQEILAAAKGVAKVNQHIVIEPEHVVQAFLISTTTGVKEMITAAHPHIQWMIDQKMKTGFARVDAEDQRDVVYSTRFKRMIEVATEMGGGIGHLAAASSSLAERWDGRGSIFDQEEQPKVLSEEEKQRAIDEQKAEEAKYEKEYQLAVMAETTPKKLALTYNFDAETGVQTIDLKAESGPGFVRSTDGPQQVKDTTVKQLVGLVRKVMGHGSVSSFDQQEEAMTEADGDFVRVGERESLGIFD